MLKKSFLKKRKQDEKKLFIKGNQRKRISGTVKSYPFILMNTFVQNHTSSHVNYIFIKLTVHLFNHL